MSEVNLGLRISALRISININYKGRTEAERLDSLRRSEARIKVADAAREENLRKCYLLSSY